jgi:hypothetical protein
MIIKLKKAGFLGAKRTQEAAKIDDILIKQDIFNPKSETIDLYFRGRDASGIIHFSKEEAKRLVQSIKPKLKLVKKFKVLKG